MRNMRRTYPLCNTEKNRTCVCITTSTYTRRGFGESHRAAQNHHRWVQDWICACQIDGQPKQKSWIPVAVRQNSVRLLWNCPEHFFLRPWQSKRAPTAKGTPGGSFPAERSSMSCWLRVMHRYRTSRFRNWSTQSTTNQNSFCTYFNQWNLLLLYQALWLDTMSMKFNILKLGNQSKRFNLKISSLIGQHSSPPRYPTDEQLGAVNFSTSLLTSQITRILDTLIDGKASVLIKKLLQDQTLSWTF